MPYVLISTGGVVLALTLLGSGACLLQHHNMMVKNGMTSYKQDLVRRKDKVKARKADTKPPAIKYNVILPSPRVNFLHFKTEYV